MQYPGGQWGQGLDVDHLSKLVGEHFSVIGAYPQYGAVGFEVEIEPEALEETFDGLAKEMLGEGYAPYLLKDGDKHFVHVTPIRKGLAQNIYLKVLLAIVTIITVGMAGMTFTTSYDDLEFMSREAFLRGAVLFGAPLFFIVGIHELAHFLVARRYGTHVSLPILIPSVPMVGVTGITLSILTFREPPRSRKALLDISVAGPLAGFIAAIGVTALGLILTTLDPHHVTDDASATITLGTPLIWGAIEYMVHVPEDVLVHPTAFVGWVGFILTFAVLVPIGGLDGGLVAKVFFKERAKWVGALAIALLCSASFLTGNYAYIVTGIFLVILLVVWKAKPPLDEISPLPKNRMVLGVAVVVMLILSFVPTPFTLSEPEPNLEAEFEHPLLVMGPGEERENTLILQNTGNTHVSVKLRLWDTHGWDVEFDENLSFPNGHSMWSERFTIEKDRSTNYTTNITVIVGVPFDFHDSEVTFVVDVSYYGPGGDGETFQAEFTVEVSPPPE